MDSSTLDWKALLFSFRGRINRGKYWLVVLINLIVGMGGSVLSAVFDGTPIDGAGGPGLVSSVILVAMSIFSLWTSLAAAVKRLHDREKSGWWMLLFGALPLILSAIAVAVLGVALVLLLVAFAIYIWGFVEIGCLKGTTGPNKYGPDPLPAEPN